MNAVLFANIEDEALLMQIVRTFSMMPYYAPLKYVSAYKQFRLHVTHRHPEWNYTYFDNRCYHALSDNYVHRSMNDMKTQ